MSAIGIGAGSGSTALADGTTANPVLEFLGRWVKWIPAEVIAIYGLTISQMQPEPDAASQEPVVSVPWFVITLAATPVVVLVAGYFAKSSKLAWRALFSIVAFAIWSSTVPHSPWQEFDLFTQNELISYGVLALLSLVLPPVFDRVVGD